MATAHGTAPHFLSQQKPKQFGHGLQQVREHIEKSFARVHDSLAAEIFGTKRDASEVIIAPMRSLEEKAAPILRVLERRYTPVVESGRGVYFVTPPTETAEALFAQILAAEG